MDLQKITEKAIELGAVQKPLELLLLVNFLQKKPPKIVVEVGTAKGGTFFALCKIAGPDATIVSIDLPGGPFGGGYERKDQKTFKSYGKKNQTLHFLRKDSHSESTKKELLKLIDGKKIDFLMIDGDHSYAGVKKDWELYSPLVKEGGLIALHDILFHPNVPECQVDKLWSEIKDRFKHEEFIDRNDSQWGGIGLIHYTPACQSTCAAVREKESKIISPKHSGMLLDISPIPNKQKGFLGMAGRKHPNIDIVHDLEKFPWPLENDSCHIVIGHFIAQKIKPWLMVDFMNELWRIIKPGGQLALSVPYAGSPGYWSDPLNCNACNESTFFYFDPQYKDLYSYYEPKPWMIEKGSPQWVVGGNLEIAMRPRK
jgi:predicted O-methyltransferase YrrM